MWKNMFYLAGIKLIFDEMVKITMLPIIVKTLFKGG
jgi:hypothetical protein